MEEEENTEGVEDGGEHRAEEEEEGEDWREDESQRRACALSPSAAHLVEFNEKRDCV